MPQTPFAAMRVSVDGGAPQTGGITVAASASLQFSAESTVGWYAQRWECFSYPSGFAAPSGWTLDAAQGVIYSTALVPPAFPLPAIADWGKWLFRLKVNEATSGAATASLTDADQLAVRVLSANGLDDLASKEGSQFSAIEAWVASQKANLRVIEAGLAATAAGTSAPTPLTIMKRDAAGRSQVVDPSAAADIATKSYVDAAITGLDWKPSVRAATTTSILLSGAQVVDGVTLSDTERVLVKDQADPIENGLFTYNSSGAWPRATDADEDAEVTAGLAVFVSEGTVNGNSGWTLTTNDPIVVGTTELVFAQFGTGGVTSVSGTAPITSTGGQTPTVAINPASGSLHGSQSAAHFTDQANATAAATATTLAKRGASAEAAFGFLTIGTGTAPAFGSIRHAGVSTVLGVRPASTDISVIEVTAGEFYLGDSALETYVYGAGTTSLGLISGAVDIFGAPLFRFVENVASPTITQTQREGDFAASDLTISSQAPSASATGANRNAPKLILASPAPTAGGAVGMVQLKSGTATLTFSHDGFGSTELFASDAGITIGVGGSAVNGGRFLSSSFAVFSAGDSTYTLSAPTGGAATATALSTITSVSHVHTKRSGTGSNAGAATTISAQDGQNQTGGAANNNGGDAIVSGGAPGTGGSGAAGLAGAARLQAGGADRVVADFAGVVFDGQERNEFVTLAYAATTDIDWDTGSNQKVTLTGDVTFTHQNMRNGGRYMLIIEQDGTGSRLLTAKPSNWLFSNGVVPTLSTGASAIDRFEGRSDGTNIYWTSALNFS